MNIAIYYTTFKEISSILYILNNHKLTQFNGYFELSNNDDVFTFISINDNTEIIPPSNFDKLVRATSNVGYREMNLNGEMKSYDYQILSDPDDPIKLHKKDVIQFIEDGNVVLSATYSEYLHKNIYYDYRFAFYYFYHQKGFNFLNFYPNDSIKDNLVGTYHSDRIKNDGNQRVHLKSLYDQSSKILQDNLFSYSAPNFKLKDVLLYQGRDGKKTLNLWEGHYVSSYTDVTNSTCFLTIESFTEDGLNGLDYINEKAFKSILYSKVNSFPILYASKKIVDILLEDGFWFLNSKFYNPKSDNLHDSVLNTMSYLRDLKSKIGSNLGVHEYLMGIYQNKLEMNSKLIDKVLSDIPNRSNLISLIKNENNN